MKIQRNDPCPCGSGKKYKKCCLLTKKEFISPQEVYMLYQGLRKDYIEDFEGYLSFIENESPTEPLNPMLLEQTFMERALYHSLPDSKRTWLQDYIEGTVHQVSSKKLADLYRSWATAVPSLLRIEQALDDSQLSGTDLFTGEKKVVLLNTPIAGETLTNGQLLFANLIPFDDERFMAFASEWFLTLTDIGANLDGWRKQVAGNNVAEIESALISNYRLMVYDLLLGITKQPLTWSDQSHKDVSKLYMDHRLQAGGAIDADGKEGEFFWNRFCESEAPVIRMPERYAAGLLSFIDEGYPKNLNPLSKKEAAAVFGASVSGVDAVERQLRIFMDNELELLHSPEKQSNR